MKNLIIGSLIIFMLSMFGCTKTIYTQAQVLGKFQTKEDVTKVFGIPTERKTNETLEAWIYKYDRSGRNGIQEVANTATTDVKELSTFKRYVLFVFDKNGSLIKWDSRGVDLAVKKVSAGKTIGLVVGVAGGAVILFIIGLALFPMQGPFDNWGS
ncbi:MAG TPA: hypothetical protein VK668_07920 [Mucilaginibacter sp.]|nr:hypothetical protein [Mucilaginibacter sp.]